MIEFSNFSIPLLLGYAELHYHLKYLYPKYYIKQPEIIADCPIRVIKNKDNVLPILLIIKDSNKFPILLKSIKVTIKYADKKIEEFFPKTKKIEQSYYSETIKCNLGIIESEQNLKVIVEINISCLGKDYTIINDNCPGLDKKPFTCYYANAALPYPNGWYAGDPHCHTIYTADQVEFGADIKSTKTMAKAMGLSWFFVTDHSYDLDDSLNDCTKNDVNLPKWNMMKADCVEEDESDFRVVPGEEVSIGNKNGENVHLLVINKNEFIHGSGDSAEIWFKNKPEHCLNELKNETEDEIYIAAHPNDKVPFMQKLTLRRGSWHTEDFSDNKIRFMQVINSADISEIKSSIEYWKNLLIQKHKILILAGNDAHGNFNVMRQIQKPFTKLFASDKQVFGRMHTVFHYRNNDPIAGIKNGEMIVSNGPFINFWIKAEAKEFRIGANCSSNFALLFFQVATAKEFGEITKLRLFLGKEDGEQVIEDPQNELEIDLKDILYLRMSIETQKKFVAFTNPIFKI